MYVGGVAVKFGKFFTFIDIISFSDYDLLILFTVSSFLFILLTVFFAAQNRMGSVC